MLTLAQIAVISSLFISLPFGRPQKQNPRRNVTQHIIEDVKMRNKSIHLERSVNITSENGSDISNLMVTAPSLLDLSTTYKTTNSTRNWPTTSLAVSPRPSSTHSTPPLVQGFVSKLPLNSSTADVNPLQVSEHSKSTTYSPSSKNFTWSLDNDMMNSSKDISSTVSPFPLPAKTTSETPFRSEPTTGWLPINNDNFAGFTPYQEKTTLQPTLKFTNNSKLFPNTSDTPKGNKNTGIVFGAILGAILGASLLSLVGYLLCGQRKTDSFSHQRLYDDRNEPVTTTQL
ncbi:mucin-15 isoform X2 [Arvicanthis niloticus]|uniref:mucin-15 isoform X2 n=1 Tax=Arvicanthis niloticus TaxID=61156 RepID=UPI0014866C72|nr:mucin-15 isoform X2 [Arvicanthis niloticus]